MIKPDGYWTIERCINETLSYNNRTDFKKKCGFAYKILCKFGELENAFKNIKKETKKSNLNREICIDKIKKCKTKKEFYKNYPNEYRFSIKNGFYKEISKHLFSKIKESNYWNDIKNCKKEALKYTVRSEFRKKSFGAYFISRKNNWLDEICSHMTPCGSKYKRCIYSYEFLDNHVYVGLTYNLQKRNNKHLELKSKKISTVGKHILLTNLFPKLNLLTDYLSIELAQEKEKYYIDKYEKDNWILLNKNKGGGLGASKFINENTNIIS